MTTRRHSISADALALTAVKAEELLAMDDYGGALEKLQAVGERARDACGGGDAAALKVMNLMGDAHVGLGQYDAAAGCYLTALAGATATPAVLPAGPATDQEVQRALLLLHHRAESPPARRRQSAASGAAPPRDTVGECRSLAFCCYRKGMDMQPLACARYTCLQLAANWYTVAAADAAAAAERVEALQSKGGVLMKMGRWADAAEAFETALALAQKAGHTQAADDLQRHLVLAAKKRDTFTQRRAACAIVRFMRRVGKRRKGGGGPAPVEASPKRTDAAALQRATVYEQQARSLMFLAQQEEECSRAQMDLLQKAEVIWRQVFDHIGDDRGYRMVALVQVGGLLTQRGRWVEAAAALEEALALRLVVDEPWQPQREDIEAYLGVAGAALRRYQEARAAGAIGAAWRRWRERARAATEEVEAHTSTPDGSTGAEQKEEVPRDAPGPADGDPMSTWGGEDAAGGMPLSEGVPEDTTGEVATDLPPPPPLSSSPSGALDGPDGDGSEAEADVADDGEVEEDMPMLEEMKAEEGEEEDRSEDAHEAPRTGLAVLGDDEVEEEAAVALPIPDPVAHARREHSRALFALDEAAQECMNRLDTAAAMAQWQAMIARSRAFHGLERDDVPENIAIARIHMKIGNAHLQRGDTAAALAKFTAALRTGEAYHAAARLSSGGRAGGEPPGGGWRIPEDDETDRAVCEAAGIEPVAEFTMEEYLAVVNTAAHTCYVCGTSRPRYSIAQHEMYARAEALWRLQVARTPQREALVDPLVHLGGLYLRQGRYAACVDTATRAEALRLEQGKPPQAFVRAMKDEACAKAHELRERRAAATIAAAWRRHHRRAAIAAQPRPSGISDATSGVLSRCGTPPTGGGRRATNPAGVPGRCRGRPSGEGPRLTSARGSEALTLSFKGSLTPGELAALDAYLAPSFGTVLDHAHPLAPPVHGQHDEVVSEYSFDVTPRASTPSASRPASDASGDEFAHHDDVVCAAAFAFPAPTVMVVPAPHAQAQAPPGGTARRWSSAPTLTVDSPRGSSRPSASRGCSESPCDTETIPSACDVSHRRESEASLAYTANDSAGASEDAPPAGPHAPPPRVVVPSLRVKFDIVFAERLAQQDALLRATTQKPGERVGKEAKAKTRRRTKDVVSKASPEPLGGRPVLPALHGRARSVEPIACGSPQGLLRQGMLVHDGGVLARRVKIGGGGASPEHPVARSDTDCMSALRSATRVRNAVLNDVKPAPHLLPSINAHAKYT